MLHKCNNFGHTTHFCRTIFVEPPRQNKKEYVLDKRKDESTKVWKKMHKKKEKEEFIFVLTALHAQNKRDRWYVDSCCSRHMTGDKSKFITLEQANEGIAKFGDNSKKDIKGKRTLSLDNGKTKTENILCVKGLKKNLLSVCQLCDQGHTVTFLPKGCEINKEGKLIANAYRTSNNLYILNEINNKRCSMGQENEIWLCH